MRAADRLVVRTLRQAGAWPAVLAIASVAASAAVLALPALVGRAVDSLIAGPPTQTTWIILTAATAATLVVCDGLAAWASGAGGARATAWVRRRAIHHVLGIGPRMTRRFTEGDLTTRIGLNADEAGRAPDAIVTGVSMVLPSAGALVMLVLIDPWLALTLVAGLVVIALLLRAFLRTSTAIASGYQEAQADLVSRLLDALSGARTIAAAGTADREADRVLGVLPRLRVHAFGLWRANADAGVRAGLVVPVLEIAVLCAGGLRLASGELTVGELYAAARYVVLGAGLGAAIGQVAGLARARAAAARVVELATEPVLRYGTQPLPPGPGRLDLRGVRAPGLDGIDLSVPGGACVAVVGRSGAGKSRLAAVLGRLADPDEGEVRLDGTPLRVLHRDALRTAVAYAFERPALLGHTITDTLTLGLPTPPPTPKTPHRQKTPKTPKDPKDPRRPEALETLPPLTPAARVGGARRAGDRGAGRTAQEEKGGRHAVKPSGPKQWVEAAAKAACVDTFVRRLPQGYDTPLDDAPMSGGERQRLGLARAFAHGERVLILDDATSSLDTVTEREVSAALTGELAGRTRIVVTHRVATAAAADRVVWLQDGRVRGHDTHGVLWTDPDYRAVFQAETP
ncbi:ABC transporter ATP-binding protein [Nonomuraea sp. NPDC050556]|uniref:ABC transporter ATP-binding protein n=1 Tax=Nonomuraea sp. NPDC050556 TaxID=3364369 RepID=UPI00378AB145